MALEARGFDTRGDRTFYTRQPYGRSDWAVTGFGFVLAITSVWLRLLGYGTI